MKREHRIRQMKLITFSFQEEKKQKAKMRSGNMENLKVSASDKDCLGRIQHFLFNHT